ncbi:MAG: purine-nucleoside phosphorylase [Bacillota bacterium]
MNQLEKAKQYIKKQIDLEPAIGLILGSGLGVLAGEIEGAVCIDYEELPDFPVSTVEGHAGRLVVGRLEGKNVITMQGRFHYYEGYSMQELVKPVRIMKMLGIEKLLVTNAAGGINLEFNPGDFMLITDHINLMGDNPLRGENLEQFGPRFPDMTEAYSSQLIEDTEKIALDLGIQVRKGIYTGLGGPSYETPAEIRYLRNIGADAVGMSTIPEVITANHMGLEVLGISCITNMAAGVLPQPLEHEEVVRVADRVKPKFIRLVRGVIDACL